jgi:hypothetical protein
MDLYIHSPIHLHGVGWICDFSIVHVGAECCQKYFIFKHQANLAFQKHFITKSYFYIKIKSPYIISALYLYISWLLIIKVT